MITDYSQILQKLEQLKPVKYAKTRNFINGDVSKLSPYISRGVISTLDVFKFVMAKGYPFYKIEKFIQEVFWRVYWKGWLELRPQVWTDFIEDLKGLKGR